MVTGNEAQGFLVNSAQLIMALVLGFFFCCCLRGGHNKHFSFLFYPAFASLTLWVGSVNHKLKTADQRNTCPFSKGTAYRGGVLVYKCTRGWVYM